MAKSKSPPKSPPKLAEKKPSTTKSTSAKSKSSTNEPALQSKIAKPNGAAKTPKAEWWEAGVRFECQGSGKCCVSRGEYGFVYMTLKDRKRMAKVLGQPLTKFTEKYCAKTDGVHHLIDGDGPDCLFLINGKCSVYEGRPDQCRSWPFWPEVMTAKRWKKDVEAFCPGVGKGRIWKAEEIRSIIEAQTKSEYDLVTGN